MILLRHGETVFNKVYKETRVDPGIVDPGLTDAGRDQAAAAARCLAAGPDPVARLVASPYTRALETAEIVAAALGVAVTVDARVREQAAFSCDTGTPASGLRQRWPGHALDHLDEVWWHRHDLHGREPEDAVRGRGASFAAAMADAEDRHEVLVVSHWAFIRVMTGVTLGNAETVRLDPFANDGGG